MDQGKLSENMITTLFNVPVDHQRMKVRSGCQEKV